MSKGKKTAPAKPTSSYKIGDRTVAHTYWNGNDYVTQYNPTSSENQSMDYIQAALPQAYKDATDNASAADYAQRYYDNQVKEVNEAMNPQMTALKDNLITGGQVGSSTGWNKIKTLSDSYADTIADLAANKEMNALNYKGNLLNYANALQGSMNNFYDLSGSLSQANANNQQSAANQSLNYWNAEQMANRSNSGLFGGLSAAGSLLGGIGTLASGWGGLAKKTGGTP